MSVRTDWNGPSYADWAARWRVPLHFAVAVVALVFAQPRPALLAGGAAMVAAGLAVRAWAAGHLRKEQPLTTSGPYAHVRHPLYRGTAIILAGFALACGRVWLAVLLAAYFLLVFLPVMRREERERSRLAPEGYREYAAQVPAFFPRFRGYKGPDAAARFDFSLYLRNREWQAAAGCGAALAVLWVKCVLG
ncbi:MAG: methyltransferase family protein [Candidatus Acidiferrales bacterium]